MQVVFGEAEEDGADVVAAGDAGFTGIFAFDLEGGAVLGALEGFVGRGFGSGTGGAWGGTNGKVGYADDVVALEIGREGGFQGVEDGLGALPAHDCVHGRRPASHGCASSARRLSAAHDGIFGAVLEGGDGGAGPGRLRHENLDFFLSP